MKFFLHVFFLLLLGPFYGQVFSATILDSLTEKPLDFATVTVVNTGYTVFTDTDGNFSISVGRGKADLQISYIGYESRSISLDWVTQKTIQPHLFYLMPKSEQLERINITSKKVDYGPTKSLASKAETAGFFSFQLGTENCSFISNPYKIKGKVTALTLDLKKVKKHAKECRECEVDYITAYSIKFYSYDEKNNRPGDEIYGKNVIVEPYNKNYTLKFDVDSLGIEFPENGICIGVETLNTKYHNPKKAGAYIGPSIKFLTMREFPVKSWVRYRQENWIFKSAATSVDRKGKTYNMIDVGVVVKIEN